MIEALVSGHTPIVPALSLATPLTADAPPGNVRLSSMVRDHLDAVWRALKRLGVPEATVDDAAQQVFLIASRKLDVIEADRERAYLLGIAVRVASDARRSLRRRREVPLDEGASQERPALTLAPDDALEQKRGLRFLHDVLAELTDEEREAFVLFELEELTAPEVAEVIGIPLGTVASRVRRARAAIRARLAEREDDS
jgi:RNA polymerase sigma-70 factor (ECF subfamily)